MAPKILVSAGEASGGLYASLVVEELRRRMPGADFFGCTGPRLRAHLAAELRGEFFHGEFRSIGVRGHCRPIVTGVTPDPLFRTRRFRREAQRDSHSGGR